MVAVADLAGCSLSVPAGAVCAGVGVAPGAYGRDQVSFGIPTGPSSVVGILYYFDRGAFAADGSYTTVEFGADQAGRLVVSGVPESAPGAMLLAGLGLLAALKLRPPSSRLIRQHRRGGGGVSPPPPPAPASRAAARCTRR